MLSKVTDEQFINAVSKSHSLREVCKLLNIGDRVKCVKKRIEKIGVDTSHFKIHKKGYTKYQKYINTAQNHLEIQGIEQKYFEKQNKHLYMFRCKCLLCGKEDCLKQCVSVLRGLTKSCGCRKDYYDKNKGKNHASWKGVGEISGTWLKKTKKHAKVRGHDWRLSLDYLWNLFLKQDGKCVFTGMSLQFGMVDIKRSCTASLDRIDNKKGYIEGNVQWVHKTINRMRGTATVEEFKHLCRMVTLHVPH
jgi:hypothetical protein